jgi:WD40 repeat protein
MMQIRSWIWKAFAGLGWVLAIPAIFLVALHFVPEKEEPSAVPPVMEGGVTGWYLSGLSFSRDAKSAYLADSAGLMLFETGKWVNTEYITINAEEDWGMPASEISPDGNRMALIYDRKAENKNAESLLAIYNLAERVLQWQKPIKYYDYNYDQAQPILSWLGNEGIAVSEPNGDISIYETSGGNQLFKIDSRCLSPTGLAANNKAEIYFVGCGERIMLIRPQNGKLQFAIALKDNPKKVFNVLKENYLAVVSKNSLQIFEIPNLKQEHSRTFEEEILDADYLENGELLIIGFASGNIIIFNLPNNKIIAKSKLSERSPALLKISPDGHWLVASPKHYGEFGVWYLPAFLRGEPLEPSESLHYPIPPDN